MDKQNYYTTHNPEVSTVKLQRQNLFPEESYIVLKQGESYTPIELPRGAFKVQLWHPCPYCGRKDKLDECKGCGFA